MMMWRWRSREVRYTKVRGKRIKVRMMNKVTEVSGNKIKRKGNACGARESG